MDDSGQRFIGKASGLRINPRTQPGIESIYADLRNATQTAQNEMAVTAAELAEAYGMTVRDMGSLAGGGRFYDARETSLRDLAERDPSQEKGPLYDTHELNAWLGLARWRVEGQPDLDFHYVDRELVAGRIEIAKGKAAYGGPEIRLDALLVNAHPGDRTPAVAEIKIRDDQNARLALVQGLAAAAQLSPESQRQRFPEVYPEHFGSEIPDRLDVYLIAHEPPARGVRPALLEKAVSLADGLHADGRIGTWIRRLVFLETRLQSERLTFDCKHRWDFS